MGLLIGGKGPPSQKKVGKRKIGQGKTKDFTKAHLLRKKRGPQTKLIPKNGLRTFNNK